MRLSTSALPWPGWPRSWPARASRTRPQLVQTALAGGTPLTRHEARWAHAELLASQGDTTACRATAATALGLAQNSGYLALVPRLRELAGR
ncbi:MAG TPA: hypothetical protein VFV73_24175 [Streptosporangiaceae bacterium]|nr:hypothetical protein [Streptosporangiaceae bacterium]